MTKKLSKSELLRRKREQSATRAKRKAKARATLDALAKAADRLIEAALVARRSSEPRLHDIETLSETYPDLPDLLRYLRVAHDADGVRILQACNLEEMDAYRSKRTADRYVQRAAKELEEWCSKNQHPPMLEAFSVFYATQFVKGALAARGWLDGAAVRRRTFRTIDNYRAIYAKLWDCGLALHAQREVRMWNSWLADSQERLPCVENPWRHPDTNPADVYERYKTAPPRRRSSGYKLSATNKGSLANLRLGPSASTRAADLAAYQLSATISAVAAEVGTNSGIARKLNERQVLTARGKLWDATSVRRMRLRMKSWGKSGPPFLL